MNNSLPSRRRRWLRFSLRTLLVLTTLFCVVMGTYIHGVRTQQDAVAKLRELGVVILGSNIILDLSRL